MEKDGTWVGIRAWWEEKVETLRRFEIVLRSMKEHDAGGYYDEL